MPVRRAPLYSLVVALLLATAAAPSTAAAQSFEQTWLEFLAEGKVSRISALIKPDRRTDTEDYAKYLLMYTNSRFCQSELARAGEYLAELNGLDSAAYADVAGFAERRILIEARFEAHARVDELWRGFLASREVPLRELESIEAVRTTCEKGTLAKYSYMKAYAAYCNGDLAGARDILENRTLRLAEATDWRIADVEGLDAEVRAMKGVFDELDGLQDAWAEYEDTGVSPGYDDAELPVVACYAVPNLKAALLRGLADPCAAGPDALAAVARLYSGDRADLPGSVEDAIYDLEELIGGQEERLAALDTAWAYFLANDEVDLGLPYGYEHCSAEAVVKAYLMDGYTFVCTFADDALASIDSLRENQRVRLDRATRQKIEALREAKQRHLDNGVNIDLIWDDFVANDDVLSDYYESTDEYCDNIQIIKDWTMRGLTGTCEESVAYLKEIEGFQARMDFKLFEDLECRVQQIRIKIYECQFAVVDELAKLEAGQSSYEQRLGELKAEYGMGERPLDCNALAAE